MGHGLLAARRYNRGAKCAEIIDMRCICVECTGQRARLMAIDLVSSKYLLEAMAEVLGAALTPEIHDAWATAYWQLADITSAPRSSICDAYA
jgi:hypothetical protein